MISSQILIQKIKSNQDSSKFINYLKRPDWFKPHFHKAFNLHRLKTGGMIFLAYFHENQDEVVGCIYVEKEPIHRSHGKIIPIFGWLEAETEEVYNLLLEEVENYLKGQNLHQLRGPINEPHLFGGWGVLVSDSLVPIMIETPQNSSILKKILLKQNYCLSTTYISLEVTKQSDYKCTLEMDEFQFISPTVKELQTDLDLKSRICALAQRNFNEFLPDFYPNRFEDILDIYSQIEDAHDFYLFVEEKKTKKIIAGIIEIPNIFEKWQQKPIEIAEVNSIVVDKEFRHKKLIYVVYSLLKQKIHSRDIKREIGVTIWKKNLPAMRVFLKSSKIIAEFAVYEKRLV